MTRLIGARHTPGPWRTVSDHREGERLCIESVTDEETQGEWSGRRIAIIGSSLAEFKANAQLIVAAPELLHVLKIARTRMLKYGESREELAEIDAAIRKAEGQP